MTGAHAVTKFAQSVLVLHSRGRGMLDITEKLGGAIEASSLHDGVLTAFVQHTSCSLFVGENADPVVQADLERFMTRLVPDGDPIFRHDAEGPDDMPAHVRSVLTATSLSLPVHAGKLALGTWQGVYLWEHRTMPHQRRVHVTMIGR
jgi:secondary thiamine-phosphate synthase enzyme